MRSVLLTVVSLVFASSAAAETVVFAGSSTVMPIMERMMPVFEDHGMELEIQGGGSSAGFKAAQMGMADVGMMSRNLSDEEQTVLDSKVIARDWIVFVANEEAPFDDITKEEVIALYTGEETTLEGQELHPIAKESGRATKKVFDKYFDLADKLAPGLTIIGANGQAIASVARDPSGLAYVSYAAVESAIDQGEPLKMLTLDGVAPTPENAADGSYPLSRALILVYQPKKSELMERIEGVLATPEAVEVFEESGVMSAQ